MVNESIRDVTAAKHHYDHSWHGKKGQEMLAWFDISNAHSVQNQPNVNDLYHSLFISYTATAKMHAFKCTLALHDLLQTFFPERIQRDILNLPVSLAELELQEQISLSGPQGRMFVLRAYNETLSHSLSPSSSGNQSLNVTPHPKPQSKSRRPHNTTWRPFNTPHHRDKRDIFSLFLGGTNAIFSLWNKFEIHTNSRRISTLQQKQGQLISHVGKAALRINANLEAITNLKATLVAHTRWDQQIEFYLFLRSRYDAIVRLSLDIRLEIQHLHTELTKLLVHKPPLAIFHSHLINDVIERMVASAAADGYTPHAPPAEADTSYSIRGHSLHFSLHLSFVQRDTLDMYSYVNSPIILNDSTHHAFLSPEMYLNQILLQTQDTTKAAIITEGHLREACKKGQDSWRCHSPILLHKKPHEICLARMLSYASLPLRPVCKFQLRVRKPFAVQMHTALLVWAEKAISVLQCPNYTTVHNIEGFKTIPLIPGCRYSSEDHDLLMSSEDLSAAINSSIIHYLSALSKLERRVSLHDVLEQRINADLLDTILQNLTSSSASLPLDVRELHQLAHQQSFESSTTLSAYSLYLLLFLLLFGHLSTLACVVVYVYRKKFLSHVCHICRPASSSSPSTPTPPPASSPTRVPMGSAVHTITFNSDAGYIDDLINPNSLHLPLPGRSPHSSRRFEAA